MTTLVDDITELLILWPHLDGALARDAGMAEAERVSGGTPPSFGLPLNADVLSALCALGTQVPAIAYWAAGIVGEDPGVRSIDGHLRHMPRWHERMLVTAAVDDAGRLAANIHALLRHTKLAVGLRTPDRPLGQFCPLHDTPLRELVAPGDEGVVRYKRLDRRGQPIEPAVEWTRHDCASCHECGASWAPSQYLMLGRLMRQADARRLDAQTHDSDGEATA
jgi:hypothetical protein